MKSEDFDDLDETEFLVRERKELRVVCLPIDVNRK